MAPMVLAEPWFRKIPTAVLRAYALACRIAMLDRIMRDSRHLRMGRHFSRISE